MSYEECNIIQVLIAFGICSNNSGNRGIFFQSLYLVIRLQSRITVYPSSSCDGAIHFKEYIFQWKKKRTAVGTCLLCGFEEQMYTETGVQRIGKWRHRIIRGF